MTLAFVLSIGFALAGAANAGPFDEGVAAYDQGQFESALKLWLPLAEQGDVAAQFNVAVMYEKGTGVAIDSAAAAHWYLAAANQGEADSQYKVAQLYETGTGLAKDSEQARHWYAALIANPRAQPATKQAARQHMASLSEAAQEVFAYPSGRFVIASSREGTCVIALQGIITLDARWTFDDVVARSTQMGCKKPWLMLESPGGGVADGISLGDQVQAHGFRTITRYECSSACSIIFLAGAERVLAGSRARIGLHQPSHTRGGSDDRACETEKNDPGVQAMARFVRSAIPATSDEVMKVIIHTSCRSITWVSGPRALELGIATSLESEGADVFGPKSAKR